MRLHGSLGLASFLLSWGGWWSGFVYGGGFESAYMQRSVGVVECRVMWREGTVMKWYGVIYTPRTNG